MAVYGPVRHQKNIIWTSEASVHIKIVVLHWHENSTINNQTDSRHLSEKSIIDEN
jgi:hypothetical protein